MNLLDLDRRVMLATSSTYNRNFKEPLFSEKSIEEVTQMLEDQRNGFRMELWNSVVNIGCSLEKANLRGEAIS